MEEQKLPDENQLLALTQPSIELSGLRLTDIIDITLLQELQDAFASCHGVASLIFSSTGEPITEASNFSQFCSILRSTERGRVNCMRSDSRLARRVARGVPVIASCQNFHEILDGAVPIIIGGQHIATWAIGQVLTAPLDEGRVRQYAHEIGADEDELVSASKKLISMPRPRFEKLVELMRIIAEDLSLLGLQNLQQAQELAERKRLEEELKKSEERYRLLIENSVVCYGILQDGRVRYANLTTERLFGYSREEMQSEAFNFLEALFPPDVRETVIRNLSRRAAGEELPDYELRMWNKNHEPIYVLVRNRAIEYEGRPAWEIQLVDITERKRAEERMNQYVEELERFNRLAVNRELRMIELKREVNELCERLGEEPRYDLKFAEDMDNKDKG